MNFRERRRLVADRMFFRTPESRAMFRHRCFIYFRNMVNSTYLLIFVLVGICPVAGLIGSNFGLDPTHVNYGVLALFGLVDFSLMFVFRKDENGYGLVEFVVTMTEICQIGMVAAIIGLVVRTITRVTQWTC